MNIFLIYDHHGCGCVCDHHDACDRGDAYYGADAYVDHDVGVCAQNYAGAYVHHGVHACGCYDVDAYDFHGVGAYVPNDVHACDFLGADACDQNGAGACVGHCAYARGVQCACAYVRVHACAPACAGERALACARVYAHVCAGDSEPLLSLDDLRPSGRTRIRQRQALFYGNSACLSFPPGMDLHGPVWPNFCNACSCLSRCKTFVRLHRFRFRHRHCSMKLDHQFDKRYSCSLNEMELSRCRTG